MTLEFTIKVFLKTNNSVPTFIGSLFTGQLFFEAPDKEFLRKQAKEYRLEGNY